VQYNYCKFLKLSNGEEIIVTTDNDCNDFKNDRYLSVMDAVQVKEMQVCRGPLVIETHVMQLWIRIAKNDIIQIPTDNILVAVDVEDDVANQYAKFLYDQQLKTLPTQNNREMVENILEELESENNIDGNDNNNQDQEPTVH